jgi:hypothetical protein
MANKKSGNVENACFFQHTSPWDFDVSDEKQLAGVFHGKLQGLLIAGMVKYCQTQKEICRVPFKVLLKIITEEKGELIQPERLMIECLDGLKSYNKPLVLYNRKEKVAWFTHDGLDRLRTHFSIHRKEVKTYRYQPKPQRRR